METSWNRHLLGASILFLLLIAGSHAKDKAQVEEERQVIKSALEKVDVWEAGTPPFRLQAGIDIVPEGKGGGHQYGTLLLSWFAPGEWRESITLPDFTQLRVASHGKVWTTRKGQQGGLRALQIERLIDLRRDWTLWPNEAVKGVKTKKLDGVEARCIEVEGQIRTQRQLCVDTESLSPISLGFGDNGVSALAEYREYIAWGDKNIPHLFRRLEDNKVVIEFKVESLIANGASANLALTPPRGGFVWDSCDDPQPARVIKYGHPVYPEAAKAAGKEGRVTVYLVVAADGSVQHPQVVISGGPDFDAATLAAEPQWRYQPAMCGTNPVPSERTETVNYILRD